MTGRPASADHRYGRVVLADCHLPLLVGVHGILAELFDAVLMVADESSLLDAIHAVHPDMAVVDLSLPCDGEIDAVRRVMADCPDVDVLVLSVHDDECVTQQLMSAGAKGVVVKRAIGRELAPAVRAVRNGGVFVSPSVHAGDRRRV